MAPNGLERLASLDDDELDALIELAQMQSGGVSRRDVVKGAGAVGLGALLGGGATGAASADASTTDSDPNIGSPSNRVDAFVEGMDANSVNTEQVNNNGSDIDIADTLNRTGLSDGVTTTLWEAFITSGRGAELEVQSTDGVSTTATTILNPGEGTRFSGLAVVIGVEDGSNDRFFDIVHHSHTAGVNILSQQDENSPDTRSYSNSVDNLELSMSANTYNVDAVGLYVATNQ